MENKDNVIIQIMCLTYFEILILLKKIENSENKPIYYENLENMSTTFKSYNHILLIIHREIYNIKHIHDNILRGFNFIKK